MVEITRTRSAGTARCAVVCVRRGGIESPRWKLRAFDSVPSHAHLRRPTAGVPAGRSV